MPGTASPTTKASAATCTGTATPWKSPCQAVVDFLASMPGHKTVILDRVPTAENLARIAFERLDAVYRDTYGNHLRLEQVRLYETPNCWADALRTRLD